MMKNRLIALFLLLAMLCCLSVGASAANSFPEGTDMFSPAEQSDALSSESDIPIGWNGATEDDYAKSEATSVTALDEPSEAISYATSTGEWIKASNGKWWYRYSDGTYPSNGWAYINGNWYYFDSSGWMLTGWLKTGGKWYYLSSSGAMVTGWKQINGTWYYFTSSGAMVTGWKQISGSWYYFTSSGAMLSYGSTSSVSNSYDNVQLVGFNDFGWESYTIHVDYTEYFTHYTNYNQYTSRETNYTVKAVRNQNPGEFSLYLYHTDGSSSRHFPLYSKSAVFPAGLWRYGCAGNNESVSYSATSAYSGKIGAGISGESVIAPFSFTVKIPFGVNS